MTDRQIKVRHAVAAFAFETGLILALCPPRSHARALAGAWGRMDTEIQKQMGQELGDRIANWLFGPPPSN